MALTDPFVGTDTLNFQLEQSTEKKDAAKKVRLNEFDGVVYSQSLDSLLC